MTTSRGQPDERKVKIALGTATIECSLHHYKGEMSSLVIVTPSANTLADYLQHADVLASLASGLFQIDARTMVWIEHTVEEGRDIFTRVQFDTFTATEPGTTTRRESPQRNALGSTELQCILHMLGYTTMDERGNAS